MNKKTHNNLPQRFLGKSAKLILRSAVVGIVSILAFALFLPSVYALTLIPPSLELGLTPNQSSQVAIKLFNEEAKAVELYTEARNFDARGETGQPEFDFNSDSFGLSSWMQMESGPIVLGAGERYEVPVTITPPLGADPGGHYAAVFFSTSPPEDGQVRISSKVGTLVLATVEGDIQENGEIAQFILKDGQKVLTRLPVEFITRFQNTGNIHLKPTGTITVSNLFGKMVTELDFNTAQGATLPSTTRKYETIWEQSAVNDSDGNFWKKFWQEYTNEKNNFAIGKYTASQEIIAGEDGAIRDTAEVSFWIIPWRLLLVWFIIAIVVVFVLIILIKKYNTWVVSKHAKTDKK
ncbi:hypothetical protein ACFL0L_00585 [Patescibacteria group bacterium]